MASIDEKKKYILDYERKFAAQLGRAVMQKPQLSSWMVFIPFIFIFYFQDLSKYKKGRRAFSESFLNSRTKALQEAEAALAERRKPDASTIAGQAEISSKSRGKYGEFLAALVDHYSSLLQADGDSYEELLQATYGRKKNYLTYLDQLATIEKALNKSLRPDLAKSVEDVNDIVSAIEKYSVKISRTDAKEFFA